MGNVFFFLKAPAPTEIYTLSLHDVLPSLREYFRDLNEIGEISFKDYLKEKKNRYTIERLLFLICENIIDFFDHILSARHDTISDSYEDVILNAYKNDLLTDSLYSNLKGLGGFRNILAHEYMGISDEEVFRNYKKMREISQNVITALDILVV